MKRDIRITYGELDRIVWQLARYGEALRTVERVIEENRKVTEAQEGEGFEAIEAARQKLSGMLAEAREEIDDLHRLFDGFVSDTGKYIHPVNRSQMTQVDRDDIWHNFRQVEGTVEGFFADPLWAFTYYLPPEPTPEQVAEYCRQQRNQAKVQQVEGSMIPAAKRSLLDEMRELWRIFDRNVVPYEDMDDEYAKKAKEVYRKYGSTGERLFEGATSVGKGALGFLEGVGTGAYETVKGIVGLAEGLVGIVVSGIGYGVSALVGVEPPNWAKERVDNFAGTAQALIYDPALLVEGMAQGVSDTYETKGLAFVIGSGAFEIGTAVVPAGALTKIGTLSKGVKVVNGVERLSDTGGTAIRLLRGVDAAKVAARNAVRPHKGDFFGQVKHALQKPKHFVGDQYDVPIKRVLDQTPLGEGTWTGVRGFSVWKPTDPETVAKLKEFGVDGIKFKNGFPDFSPFAKPKKRTITSCRRSCGRQRTECSSRMRT
jgi:hypothetical protein